LVATTTETETAASNKVTRKRGDRNIILDIDVVLVDVVYVSPV